MNDKQNSSTDIIEVKQNLPMHNRYLSESKHL